PNRQVVVTYLERLSPEKHARLARLMDKSDAGTLTSAERAELKRLGREVDEMLLANSKSLAQAMRPELFDSRGQPVRHRLRGAARQSVRRSPVARRRSK
ncbi:MAG TPA: hypothetical protein VGM03_08955, partial [Phycisphaerae bacterium]